MTDWTTHAEAYKARIAAQIPAEWRLSPETLANLPLNVTRLPEDSGLLSDREKEIKTLDATSLAAAIAARTYSAVEVAKTYAKAAAISSQATHSVMDFFPDEAAARAQWLDDELARTGKPVGPLHGVPISVKDMIGLAGRARTCGSLTGALDPALQPSEDSVIVDALRRAGAVFYVKTTNPQAIMHLETNSFLGETLNPWNTRLTPGGSSGGESSLIAGGGSVLGIGTDIGGSIRNPCSNCGLFGFKPTAARIPKQGNVGGMPGQETIIGAVGPMAVSARDCELFVSSILAAEPWKRDPTMVGMPWRPEAARFSNGGERPRIGVMWDDGVVVPQPPMRRALSAAVDKLKAAGYDVVDFTPYRTAESWEILRQLYFTDGGAYVRGQAAKTGEPILPLTEWIMAGAKDNTATEVMALNRARDAFRLDWWRYFAEQKVDLILTPAYPGPAPVLGTSKYWAYTALFNILDMPGAVFPTGLYVDPQNPADKADVEGARPWLSEEDKLNAERYDAETFVGAPLALQIVGARWEDEMVVKALYGISDVVRA
ncbi:hypothetical protein VHUM_03647 [Vanrija humicola]|uniref:amidase n=1 Tax=Vanrija humicola TaxID=5417 RepID=A0A7D8V3E2_VANHU|nr:hypothetical protein VHUM_03647 [Vanrija humicola]